MAASSLLFQASASLSQPQTSQQNKHRHHLLQVKSPSLCCSSSGLVSPFSLQHCSSVNSSFNGQGQSLVGAVWAAASGSSYLRPVVAMSKPAIQFIRGVNELTVPDVQLTRSRDGTNGVATFLFEQPSVFDSSGELGDITGLYLLDEEGILQSVDVSAKFVNGKPAKIEAKYLMRSQMEWDRFMRFMERYGEANGLGFVKK